MEPGRHTDISIEQYHAGPGVSRSRLMDLEDGSPLLCRYRQTNPTAPSDAMNLGNVVDALVYEPDTVKSRFLVTSFGTRTKSFKELVAENPGRTVITEDMRDRAAEMAAAVLSSPVVKALMGKAQAQESWYWDEAGTLCKCRPDGYDAIEGWTFDLKTTNSLVQRKMDTSMVDYGYDVQMAMNLCGARANGLRWNGHVIIWVNKSAPIDVRPQFFSPSSNWVTFGLSRFERLRKRYQACVDADSWPGFSGVLEEPQTPTWISHKLAAEEELERAQEREGVMQ